jgi:large subunit ribosomal protein L24
MKIHKGDNVIVVAGKDNGKTGKVVRVLPKKGAVVVEGINLIKKHMRPRANNQKGGIIDKTMPINVSNVMMIHPKTKKGVRVGYDIDGGKKVRVTRGKGGKAKV